VLTSVIIPTFDRRELVREAVASVLAQQGAAFELIVVDDGSTDGSAAALEAEFGSALTVLRTANRGVAAARNAGVAVSRGELLAFLDSDDTWLPGKLAAQVAVFTADPQVAFCHTQEVWVRNGRRMRPHPKHRKPAGIAFAPSLRLCLVGASTVILRRTLFDRVGGFAEDLPACEDYDLWLRIARDTPFHLIDEPFVVKRDGHGGQLSHRYWGMDRFRIRSLARLLASGTLDAAQTAATRAVLFEKCGILANGAERRGRGAEARSWLELAETHA
jgi:glycosyltransferase involved in cell wall biosynthesis